MYSFAVSSLSLATHMLLKHLNKSVFVRPGVRGGGSVWIECCVLSEISTVSTDGRACLCLLCLRSCARVCLCVCVCPWSANVSYSGPPEVSSGCSPAFLRVLFCL